MTPDLIPLRLGLQQRVMPTYRAAFFEALAESCRGGKVADSVVILGAVDIVLGEVDR